MVLITLPLSYLVPQLSPSPWSPGCGALCVLIQVHWCVGSPQPARRGGRPGRGAPSRSELLLSGPIWEAAGVRDGTEFFAFCFNKNFLHHGMSIFSKIALHLAHGKAFLYILMLVIKHYSLMLNDFTYIHFPYKKGSWVVIEEIRVWHFLIWDSVLLTSTEEQIRRVVIFICSSLFWESLAMAPVSVSKVQVQV